VNSMAQKSVWTCNGYRTAAGHAEVNKVNAYLEAHGRTRSDHKAVQRAIAELHPECSPKQLETLRINYYRIQRLPPPLATEEDRWISLLVQWGRETDRFPASMTAEQAHEIVNRVIKVASHRRADLNQLFSHMDCRIHWNGRQKIKWLQSVIARLETNPFDWPIPISPRGRPDVTAGMIETYLANAYGKRAHKRDIVAALRIPRTTGQTTLCSMERAGRIVRVANGVYALPMEGIRNYVPADKAIVDMLAAGPRTNAELIVGTGLTEGAIHAAVHRLGMQDKIIRVKRGKYALPGTVVPHVYAKDAINEALQSGSKTVSELMIATGKNRGEIWQALHRLKAKGLIIGLGRRGYQAAFALSPKRKTLRRAAWTLRSLSF
jgi:hypothetical protein